jgi:hypothetical protein
MEEKAITHTGSVSDAEMTQATEVTPIAQLRPTSHEKIIEARLYRKWVAKTYPQKIETALCCILIDREVCGIFIWLKIIILNIRFFITTTNHQQGNAIQGTVPKSDHANGSLKDKFMISVWV